MMPMRMRRKTRGMEKVENLYRTARVQNAVPRGRDHMVESDQTDSNFRDEAAAFGPDTASGTIEGGS